MSKLQTEQKKNRTTLLMLPLIISERYAKYFNAYFGINKFDDISGIIYLTLEESLPETIINDIIVNKSTYQGSTVINSKPVYMVKLEDKYINDYKQFCIGNYTKISKDSKGIIFRFWMNSTYGDCFKRVTNILFDYNIKRDELLKELSVNKDKIKELEKALHNVIEVESIPKLEDELIFT